MNMRFARTGLIATLLLVVILSVTGGTIAWFSDSVESTGNVIESGNLDLKFYAADAKNYDGSFDAADEITNASPALFNYKLWEPGYTDVKHVKIENGGNLAFKWHLRVKPAMSAEFVDQAVVDQAFKLAEVIEVYLVPAGNYNSFAEIKTAYGDKKAPTLYELIYTSVLGSSTDEDIKIDISAVPNPDPDGVAYGVLLPSTETGSDAMPAGSVEYVIALHMQETADNEYQGLSVGKGFVVELRAEQFTYESDSFDNQYDANATNDIPSAYVRAMSDDELAADSNINKPALDVGYLFATTDHPASVEDSGIYSDWHADFAVTFDKPIYADQIGLTGYYKLYADSWINFDIDSLMIDGLAEDGVLPAGSTYIPANTSIRLLHDGTNALFDKTINFSYEALAQGVLDFYCGAYKLNQPLAEDVTMTVALTLYEPASDETNENREEETDKSITLGSFQHTFKATSTN